VTLDAGKEVRVIRGLATDERAVVEGGWRRSQTDLLGVTTTALARGATTDRRVLGASLERTILFRSVMAPLGGTETLVLVPSVGALCLGMFALGRRGGRYSDAALAHAQSLVPVLSLACRALLGPRALGPAVTAAEA